MQKLQCTFVTGDSVQELEVAAVLNMNTGEVEIEQELQLDFKPDNEYIEIKGSREPLIREGNILRVSDHFIRTLHNQIETISPSRRVMAM